MINADDLQIKIAQGASQEKAPIARPQGGRFHRPYTQ